MANDALANMPERPEPTIGARAVNLWWYTTARNRGLNNLYPMLVDPDLEHFGRRATKDDSTPSKTVRNSAPSSSRAAAPAAADSAKPSGTLGDRAYALSKAGKTAPQIARELRIQQKRVPGLVKQGERRAK